MRKKVLVTGAKGMLGTDLVARLQRSRRYDIVAVDIEEMDITRLSEVKTVVLAHRPQIVIHCAAYTAVDKAESEREQARAINSEGTKHVAFFCRELAADMIYISTDYAFDGRKEEPYLETDDTNPINVYGLSKLLGEQHVAELVHGHKICRTSWLCGVHGHNFIETMLRIAGEGRPLSVVNDQFGRPTFTFDLADAIVRLLERPEYGVFHVTNSGYCSWFEFAQRILKLGGFDPTTVKPITSAQFRSLARRPRNSVLENRRLKELGFPPLPHWEESLKEYFVRRHDRQTATGRRAALKGKPASKGD
jgi:dTDP-4-dehydrorhamnose reductase